MKLRKVFVAVVMLLLAAGLVYGNFSRQAPTSLPAAGPQMLAMEEGELEALAAGPQPPVTYDISGPYVENEVKAISFDKDLRHLPQIGPAERRPMREMLSPDVGPVSEGAAGLDSVAQTLDGLEAMPAASASFKGLDFQSWGAGWPPDTVGDVGPDHYIQAVNTSIGIYDKTGTRLAAFTFNTFFDGTGTPCDASNQGDPVVLYDHVSGRWIITDFAWSSTRGPFYECIAVSKSADPVAGGWYFYGLAADSTSLNDYPKLGVWSDGIYMSANMFKRMRSYSGTKVWALNRDDLINGRSLRSVSFLLGTAYFSLLPANVEGTLPPAGTPAFFMSFYAPSTLRLWKFTVNWTTPSASTFSGPTHLTVASFTRPTYRIPQLNSSEALDSLGDRLMMQLQYRNNAGVESLWANHSVVSNSVTGLRWYEVRSPNTAPVVFQQGTYQPDLNHRWMGALAVDKQGNMALGYSVSSASMYPAIRYAGRLAADPLGQLSQGETTLIAGTGSQSGGYNRWGDYSAMSVDPLDDCTFWYTTEYYEVTGNNWQTRIGAFKFPGCTP